MEAYCEVASIFLYSFSVFPKRKPPRSYSSSSFFFLLLSYRVERVAIDELVGRDRVGQHVELEDHQGEGRVGLRGFFFLREVFLLKKKKV